MPDANSTISDHSFAAEDLIKLQMDRLTSLENIKRNFSKDSANRKTEEYFRIRLLQVSTLFDQFSNSHRVIVCTAIDSESDYFKSNVAMKFEELYLETYCIIIEARDAKFPTASTASNNGTAAPLNVQQNVSSVKVPEMPNPTFSGELVDWPSFHDAFHRLVHQNRSLNTIQRFYFLKLALPSGQDMDIHKMQLTEANYPVAWDLLVQRYNNPRVLFDNQMKVIFSLPVLQRERSSDIKQLITEANVCISEFKRLEVPIDDANQWLTYLLSTKLSKETHQAWQNHLGSRTAIPTYAELKTFLTNRLVTIDSIENRNLGHTSTQMGDHKPKTSQMYDAKSSKRGSHNERKSFHASAKGGNAASTCVLCNNGSHVVRYCPSFLAKDCFQRKAVADQYKLCINCLCKSHFVSKCPSGTNCRECGQRHHTLLHFTFNPVNTATAYSSGPSTSSLSAQTNKAMNSQASNDHQLKALTTKFVSENHSKKPTKVLLATALIPVVNVNTGRSIVLRALIDQGSEGTFITERAASALGLKRTLMRTDVTGIGDRSGVSTEYVSFELRSNLNNSFQAFVEMAFVMEKVTSKLPSQQIEPQDWPHIHGLVLADPTYFAINRIDLLIGSEMSAAILLPDQRIGRFDHPIAQNSQFGWILWGKVAATASTSTPSVTVRCHHTSISTNLEKLVQHFFDSEQVPEERVLSEEDQWFVDFFNKTCTRQSNGKYMVRLPLKTIFDPNQTLGRSKQIALNRFHQLERRLLRAEGLMERYSAGIHEYFELNQIVPSFTSEDEHCTVTETGKSHLTTCVLAHHAVIREESLTTKLRVVFDASAKTSNGKSLNDILCIGPKLQSELPAVVLNWRLYQYVFTSDIQKMYRCIDMHPDDVPYHKILWRNESGEIQEFCLTTVTFGTAPAPCTAISVINKIAEDEKHRYPLAENVLRKEMYVDDVQSGGHSLEEAIQVRDQVNLALASAGMELRKWASNHSALLESIPIEHQYSGTLLEFDSSEVVKTLGMCWQPNEDVFKFTIRFALPTIVTKRAVLSTIARLYDPLGFVTPIVVTAKILLKRIWSIRQGENATSLDWDATIPEPIHSEWLQFIGEFHSISQISIPRWLDYSPQQLQSIQLHVFCDGSSSAFASNVYIRLEYLDRVYTHLLIAKSKTTPAKSVLTIPRVELCGAELASRLAFWVKKNLRTNVNDIPVYFWSDATIVLHWIKGDVNRWKTYVANRVSKILSNSSPTFWNHVDTKENPSDCATRGLTPSQLATFDLWWKGPSWLVQPNANWPTFNTNEHEFDEMMLEAKSTKVHVHVTVKSEAIVFQYSSLTRLIRIAAWIFRYRYNCCKTNQSNRRTGALTVIELRECLFKLIHLVQLEAFGNEIHLIHSNELLPNKSKIKGLAPFIDELNILRVRGRLQRSNLPYRQKHPIILPSKHHFTRLLIDNSHQNTLHGGVQLTLWNLRQQYWIVNGRQTVARQLRKCVKCFRNKPEVSTQLMGNLPYHRVNPPTRPFESVGIDYTGAIELKSSRFRGNTTYKAYIVIFICLATKAIHLEVVTGMSTEHFMMALHRFIGRRGLCRDIFSDNGTNFIGADNVLNPKQFAKAIEKDVVPKLAEKGIQWHFNPPHSPNFGGLWEANVKSTKYHLKRIVDSTRMTYEELSTVLIRIESCLNSRPLCPLTSDPDDLAVLTPGHFLIGDALLAPPPEYSSNQLSFSSNYVALQRMIQQFWEKWSSDWLSHLQNRPKWHQEQPNLQLNDLVLVKDDRLPPNEWVLGRIIELHPGADQLIRVVTVRTQNGVYKRSVSKLCRLPINEYTTETDQQQ